jgi:hypothetical protein
MAEFEDGVSDKERVGILAVFRIHSPGWKAVCELVRYVVHW